MRDPELMLSLLQEMASNEGGRIDLFSDIFSEEEPPKIARQHHTELLVDAGHATWTNDSRFTFRITNTGYDFLNAIEQGPAHRQKFFTLLNNGMKWVSAANEIVDLASKAAKGFLSKTTQEQESNPRYKEVL